MMFYAKIMAMCVRNRCNIRRTNHNYFVFFLLRKLIFITRISCYCFISTPTYFIPKDKISIIPIKYQNPIVQTTATLPFPFCHSADDIGIYMPTKCTLTSISRYYAFRSDSFLLKFQLNSTA